ncbi:IceA2 protein [Helicobacter bilis]|nr:IceA2 protein [Helicobacter bilis]
MAYIVKVEQGKAKIYDGGSYKRSVGSNVIACDCDDEWVACVEKKCSQAV